MQWYKRLSRDKDKLYKNSPSSPSSSSASPLSHKHKHNTSNNISIPQTSASVHSTASYAGTVGSIATFGSIPSPISPLPPSTIPPRTSSQNAPLLFANLPIPNLPSSSSYKLAQVPEAISPFSSSSPSSSSSLSFTAAATGGGGIGFGRIRSRSQSLSYTHSRSHSYTSHSHSHSHSRSVAPAIVVISSSATTMSPPPPPDPSRYATEDLDFIGKKSWNLDKEKVVCGPYDYLFGHPGKDFRSQLIKAFDVWLDVPSESLAIITQVVGMLHTASLLIDDVEDSSSLRRGLPVAHNIFGVAQTINSANYVYFRALQEVQRLRSPTAITVFADELLHLHRGQGMDLFWRDSLTCPSEEDYLEMVGNKTGGLFRLGIKLMQAESRTLIDCVPLVNLVGLIFQIRDDYMNLSSTEYSDNKGLCEDLTEGKFSFPIIHAIRADPANTQLINILRQKTSDVDVKRYAVAHLEAMGSFAYTRKVVNILIERARKVAMEVDEGRGKVGRILAILDMMILPEVEVGSQSESNTETEGDRKGKWKSGSEDEREKETPGAIKALQALAMQQEHQRASLDRISRGV